MQLPAFLTIALSLGLFIGCSGGSGDRIEVRDGVAICIREPGGNEVKLGTVQGDTVELYAMYGGTTVPIKDVENAVANMEAEPETGSKEERTALINALRSLHVAGIWKVESASVNGKVDPVSEDGLNYLVLRVDQTLKIIKKGKKPTGTWSQTGDKEFVLNLTDGTTSKTAKFKWLSPDKLELTMDDDGKVFFLTYGRTDLTKEPKAADE